MHLSSSFGLKYFGLCSFHFQIFKVAQWDLFFPSCSTTHIHYYCSRSFHFVHSLLTLQILYYSPLPFFLPFRRFPSYFNSFLCFPFLSAFLWVHSYNFSSLVVFRQLVFEAVYRKPAEEHRGKHNIMVFYSSASTGLWQKVGTANLPPLSGRPRRQAPKHWAQSPPALRRGRWVRLPTQCPARGSENFQAVTLHVHQRRYGSWIARCNRYCFAIRLREWSDDPSVLLQASSWKLACLGRSKIEGASRSIHWQGQVASDASDVPAARFLKARHLDAVWLHHRCTKTTQWGWFRKKVLARRFFSRRRHLLRQKATVVPCLVACGRIILRNIYCLHIKPSKTMPENCCVRIGDGTQKLKGSASFGKRIQKTSEWRARVGWATSTKAMICYISCARLSYSAVTTETLLPLFTASQGLSISFRASGATPERSVCSKA